MSTAIIQILFVLAVGTTVSLILFPVVWKLATIRSLIRLSRWLRLYMAHRYGAHAADAIHAVMRQRRRTLGHAPERIEQDYRAIRPTLVRQLAERYLDEQAGQSAWWHRVFDG